MAKKKYDWVNLPKLDAHTKCKHQILQDYLTEYLVIRCRNRELERFQIAIIDGFCGGGRYEGNSPGSPIIILEVLKKASEEINIRRAAENSRPLLIDVLLILNDLPEAIKLCKEHTAPLLAEVKDNPHLFVNPHFSSGEFEELYPNMKALIVAEGYHSNVFYNLDQYGHANVGINILRDIMGSHRSPEILFTFAIQALMTYLPKENQEDLVRRLNHLGLKLSTIQDFEGGIITNRSWLGMTEVEIFNAIKGLAPFTSPFAINNPDGWCYWLIHFAKNYRARQAYNDVLHKNSSAQAHFGRSGLEMLSYNPEDGMLYSFKSDDRDRAIEQLRGDIPKALANFGDAIAIENFFQAIYNETPAHSDDINEVILSSPDLKVITPTGAERKTRVEIGDTLKLNSQSDFFSVLALDAPRKSKSDTNSNEEK